MKGLWEIRFVPQEKQGGHVTPKASTRWGFGAKRLNLRRGGGWYSEKSEKEGEDQEADNSFAKAGIGPNWEKRITRIERGASIKKNRGQKSRGRNNLLEGAAQERTNFRPSLGKKKVKSHSKKSRRLQSKFFQCQKGGKGTLGAMDGEKGGQDGQDRQSEGDE